MLLKFDVEHIMFDTILLNPVTNVKCWYTSMLTIDSDVTIFVTESKDERDRQKNNKLPKRCNLKKTSIKGL